ncbi:MAG TPA: class I SAM-dependent methyltransferase [Clostridiaceae bacterium]|nr:class I SAM-dependent methyltransferase [Clostridiaceae bacterium]
MRFSKKPEIYAPSTSKFWDDEHISKGMLEAHLHPDWDAATRNHGFVTRSADWIAQTAPPARYPKLLDLGCGPGLYAERFHLRGYQVTGMDFSRRSIDYAKAQAEKKGHAITYHYGNYLDLSYEAEFDVATLIYCDLGVLSTEDRGKLLGKVRRALKPGGMFILDVFTPRQYEGRKESTGWSYEEGGFWNAKPHLCLDALYSYEEGRTMLSQTIVVTAEEMHCYNIWEHVFTRAEMEEDLQAAGFQSVEFYGDVAGASFDPEGKLFCAVSTR